MDISQLAIVLGAVAGVLIVVLLAIAPTLVEHPIPHRQGRHKRRADSTRRQP